jgi:hypothetical protein
VKVPSAHGEGDAYLKSAVIASRWRRQSAASEGCGSARRAIGLWLFLGRRVAISKSLLPSGDRKAQDMAAVAPGPEWLGMVVLVNREREQSAFSTPQA